LSPDLPLTGETMTKQSPVWKRYRNDIIQNNQYAWILTSNFVLLMTNIRIEGGIFDSKKPKLFKGVSSELGELQTSLPLLMIIESQ
jgi:hypothetical protein